MGCIEKLAALRPERPCVQTHVLPAQPAGRALGIRLCPAVPGCRSFARDGSSAQAAQHSQRGAEAGLFPYVSELYSLSLPFEMVL